MGLVFHWLVIGTLPVLAQAYPGGGSEPGEGGNGSDVLGTSFEAGGGAGGGGLASTGAQVLALVALAVVLIVVGGLAVRRARQRNAA